MNIFELLWFSVFIGGGGILGHKLIPGYGIILGVVIGIIGLYLISHLSDLSNPECICGAESEDYESFYNEDIGIVYKCPNCNGTFIMRGGNKWYQLFCRRQPKISYKKKFS